MKTRTVGVRLTPVLEQRLAELCAVAQRRPSVVLRALIATATTDNLPSTTVVSICFSSR